MTIQHDHPPDDWLLSYIDGELPRDIEGGLEAHLAGCRACRSRLVSMREVSDALGDFGASVADRRPDRGQRQALMEAMAGRSSGPAVDAPRGRRRLAAAISIAAAAVVLLALLVRLPNKPSRPANSGRAAAADASGFIALPYSDENLSQEGAVVLEVEVPRSALMLAGMPAAESGSSGRVKAEVMVGADGLARAIRFLN